MFWKRRENGQASQMDIPPEIEIDVNEDFDIESEKTFFEKIKEKIKRKSQEDTTDLKSIEAAEMRLQQDIELFDPYETIEDMPDTFTGQVKYLWHNNERFRVGLSVLAALLIAFLIIASLQTQIERKQAVASKETAVAEEQQEEPKEKQENPEEEPKERTEEEIEQAAAEALQALDPALLPADIDRYSLEPDPNVAEIISIGQDSVGKTPETYEGSETKELPVGAIGSLSIPAINLKNAPVMPTVELSDLSKGTGHFTNTPIFNGNVGIAGHNNTHFKYLVNIDIGDEVEYTVSGVTRRYLVADIRAISDTNWGVFNDQGDNRLTLITCEHLVPNRRIAVTAIQIGSEITPPQPELQQTPVITKQVRKQESSGYNDAGSGYTDYIGSFTGTN